MIMSVANTIEVFNSPQQSTRKSAKDTYKSAPEDLSEFLVIQIHTATHYRSGNQYGKTKPPYRIEIKQKTIGQQCPYKKPGSGRVHTYLVPDIYQGTDALRHKANNQYAAYEGRKIQAVAHIHT